MTKLYILNPKAVSVIELYGILDPTTRDWTDGVLSNIFREINKPTDKKERKWVPFWVRREPGLVHVHYLNVMDEKDNV